MEGGDEETGMRRAADRAKQMVVGIVGLYVELAQSALRLVPGRS